MEIESFRDLETGSPEIDGEHALQVQMIRAVRASMALGNRDDALDLMTQLEDVTNAHFTGELLLMRQSSYPAYRIHEAEHDRLLDDLRALRRGLANGGAEQAAASTSALERWLVSHITTADRAFVMYLRSVSTR